MGTCLGTGLLLTASMASADPHQCGHEATEAPEEVILELEDEAEGDAPEEVSTLKATLLKRRAAIDATLSKLDSLEKLIRGERDSSNDQLKAISALRDKLMSQKQEVEAAFAPPAQPAPKRVTARLVTKRHPVAVAEFASPPAEAAAEPAAQPAAQPAAPPAAAAPEAATEAAPSTPTMEQQVFHEFLKSLDHVGNDGQRLRVLREDPRRYALSAKQLFHVLLRHRGDHTRLKALEILAPRLTNPRDARQIYPAFDAMRNRYRARSIIVRSLDLTAYPKQIQASQP